MKTKYFIALILAFALSLCACAPKAAEPVSEPAPEPAAVEAAAPEAPEAAESEAPEAAQPEPVEDDRFSQAIGKTAALTPGTVATASLNSLFEDPGALPQIDGSTACIPLMLQIVEEAAGLSPDDAQFYINCTTTNYCWINLLSGKDDLILAYEMPESAKELWDESYGDVELEVVPIGLDALVFLVNGSNPVTSLTQQQLVDIYTGTVTNWSEVGGEDLEIAPFQRDPSSGSQTLFRKLLMKDVEPMRATDRYVADDMGFLIEAIANYDNAANAIGYSVYYYTTNMKNDPSLRLLRVDGAAPNDDTIADGSYPLCNEFYAAIRSDAPEGSPARALFDWLRGASGEACLRSAGYVPA